MKINWAKRFENKTFVISFATVLVGFVYQIVSLFGIVPAVSENEVMQLIVLVVNILVGLGILVDPTTKGMSDSARVLYGYRDMNDVSTELNKCTDAFNGLSNTVKKANANIETLGDLLNDQSEMNNKSFEWTPQGGGGGKGGAITKDESGDGGEV